METTELEDEPVEDTNALKGLVFAFLLSLPFWCALAVYAVWKLLK